MTSVEELKATGLILDAGVKVPLRPFRFFRLRLPRSITMRMPYPMTLVEIANQYLSIGVTYEEFKDYTFEQNMAFVGKHIKPVSRIIAGAIVRDYTMYRLFGGLVAWWVRHRMEHIYQAEAMYQLLSNLSMQSFGIIIRSAETVNPMTPHLSH